MMVGGVVDLAVEAAAVVPTAVVATTVSRMKKQKYFILNV